MDVSVRYESSQSGKLKKSLYNSLSQELSPEILLRWFVCLVH